MAASEQLDKAAEQLKRLSARAAQGEAGLQVALAQNEKALKDEVDAARAAAASATDKLKVSGVDAGDEAAQRWADVQSKWKSHVSKIRQDVADKRTAQDVKLLTRLADRAEQDAVDAVDFAYAAYDQAVYLVLNAAQLRREADAAAGAVQ